MAWRWTGDKPLSAPMMTQFNDAYVRHSTSMTDKLSLVDIHRDLRVTDKVVHWTMCALKTRISS